jgi:hypothetical protein
MRLVRRRRSAARTDHLRVQPFEMFRFEPVEAVRADPGMRWTFTATR